MKYSRLGRPDWNVRRSGNLDQGQTLTEEKNSGSTMFIAKFRESLSQRQ